MRRRQKDLLSEWKSILDTADISAIRGRKRDRRKKTEVDTKTNNETPSQEPVQDTFEPEI